MELATMVAAYNMIGSVVIVVVSLFSGAAILIWTRGQHE